ncbi:MAG: efflux RND transporter permease subunit [Anaerolineae bacterium]|nr:efflux RND transporter permease subunit [Anaerolineae bacterium]
MLSRFFDKITRLSVRFKWVTLILTFAVLAAGLYALTQLNQELLPPISFPQTIVVTQWSDSESAEQLLSEITDPLDAALSEIEGVVNVESTTNNSFAVTIVRNEFGLNQDRVVETIETLTDAFALPEGAEIQVFTFDLGDLPVVISSISSSELTLPELKAVIENELRPTLLDIENVSEVAVSGGQEMPKDEPAAGVVDDSAEPEPEPTATPNPAAAEKPLSRLNFTLRTALSAYGFDDIENAQDITAEQALAVIGLGDIAIQALEQLSDENLLAIDPETLAYLPSDYTETLDSDLLDELNARSAEFGGVGQFTLAEAVAAKEAGVNVLTGEPLDAAAIIEVPTATPEPEPTAEPVEETVATGVALPDEWVQAAAAQGVTITTTADLTPEFIGAIVTLAPESLQLLTPEMVLALSPEQLAVLPEEFIASLDEGTQAALLARAESSAETPTVEPVALPEELVAGAAAQGLTITTTADLTPELLGGIAQVAPESLQLLTPEMWRSMPPETLAAVLPVAGAALDADLVAQLAAIVAAATGEMPDSAELPQSWIDAAATAGFPIETTEDILPEALSGIAGLAPELLADLTPEIILALTPANQAALPADYIATLDEGLQETLAIIAIRDAQFQLAQAEESGTDEEMVEEEPVDPARLPDLLVNGFAQQGLEIENAQDIPADLMRQLSGIGEQATQLLGLLTPDNLRLLQPEVIALLPEAFLDTLDTDLRAELDELAAEFGGAGQLAIQEAEEAAALAEGAPALSGAWLEPGPDGEPPLFTTAADLVNNPFAPGAAALLSFLPQQAEDPGALMSSLTPNVIAFIIENEPDFLANMPTTVLELMSAETLQFIIDEYGDDLDAEKRDRLAAIAAGEVEVFVPESSITRSNSNPALILQVFKEGDANTVTVAHEIFDALDAFEANNGVDIELAFEQASFIEDSINGVAREGLLGAFFAVIVILIFLSGRVNGKYKLSWRATLIVALSIPTSVLFAILLMWLLPVTVGQQFETIRDGTNSSFLRAVLSLIPAFVTLNIMTLSGLTVAIGRVVDDSIVVLENSYRYIQKGHDPEQAVFQGTQEVAVAIFSATITTMAVFLPLGLIGGLIGTFFLPFGLTVTYALAASFIVSITAVPALTSMLIRKENIPEEKETWMQRTYTPMLVTALKHRAVTMIIALLLFFGAIYLLTTLPQSFIPSLGEPTVNVTIQLPSDTGILETNERVTEFEETVSAIAGVETILTEVGGAGGFESFFGGGGVAQNAANLTISVLEDYQEEIDGIAETVRMEAADAFGEDNASVSAASQTGFSGFSIIITADSLDDLLQSADDIQAALAELDADDNGKPDLFNITTNADAARDGATIIRIDGRPAISFSAELDTADTIGIATSAKEAINAIPGLPANTEASEGFDTQQQTEGFASMVSAIGISIIIVYIIMAITFRSLVHPFVILFSLPFAMVGAALALWLTGSVLGIAAMVGMLMLVGVVVTNGIVLMELVKQLKEKGELTYDALVEAGRTRLRPIWMTALTAILALIPLALSREGGAIIAGELGITVIGGLLVATALTLIVVPVVYSLLDQGIVGFKRRIGRSQ